MGILSERVKSKRVEKGLSQTDLARLVGVKPQSIQQLEAGDVGTPRYLHRLAEALGVTWQWLMGDEAAAMRKPRNGDGVAIPTNGNRLPSFGERDLPVYGAALGGDGAIMLNRTDEVDRVHRPPALFGVKDAFGVVVAGDSMEPMFLQGDIAWIHPGRPPMPRRGVLVEMHDGHAQLKEYVSQNDEVVRCRQHNPAGPVTYKRRDVKRLYLVVGSGLYG